MTECPSCGCHQPDGLLCWEDTAAFETMMNAVPELVDQLQVAIGKQAKLSESGKAGKGSAHERSPLNWGAVATRDALMVEVALHGHDIDALRKNPDAGKIVSRMGRVVKDAYRCIDRMADRKYLGQCEAREDGAVCHAELWVKPGAHQVQCTQCETVHEVSAKRADLLERAKDMIVTPVEASSYLGEVGDFKVGQQRIRNYLDRKRIPSRPSPDGTMRFRLGDLMELLGVGATRLDTEAS